MQEMTVEEYNACLAEKPERPRRQKFRNHPVEYDGYWFDSEKECQHYKELRLLEAAGEIENLQVKPKFEVLPAFREAVTPDGSTDRIRCGPQHRATYYEADFSYYETKHEPFAHMDHTVVVVEDVKALDKRTGKAPTRTPVFELKRKMLLYHYPEVDFRIVYV